MIEAPAIVCEGVEFSYGKAAILRAASFTIPARCISCLVGPNGGGKSTLLKLILGLLQPQAGRIQVLGGSPEQARLRVGYMPQQINLDPLFPIKVREKVLMGTLRGNRWGFPSRAEKLFATKLLEEVELNGMADVSFAHLSGGQKQRVLIARALAADPELLLLDEPTAMVDSHIEARLLEQLRDLHKRMTILMVSHDAGFIANLVDTVFHVNVSVTSARLQGGHLHAHDCCTLPQ